jgi:hypothetical protein
MRRPEVVLFVLMIVAVGAAIVYFAFFGVIGEPIAPRNIIKAKGDVQVLELFALGESFKKYLAGAWHTNSGAGEVDAQILCDHFLSTGSAGRENWRKAGRFVDSWGHNYHFLLDRHGSKEASSLGRLVVRSFGPDGIDQQGKGDDISSTGVELGP